MKRILVSLMLFSVTNFYAAQQIKELPVTRTETAEYIKFHMRGAIALYMKQTCAYKCTTWEGDIPVRSFEPIHFFEFEKAWKKQNESQEKQEKKEDSDSSF